MSKSLPLSLPNAAFVVEAVPIIPQGRCIGLVTDYRDNTSFQLPNSSLMNTLSVLTAIYFILSAQDQRYLAL